MADGIEERNNLPAQRGRKIRIFGDQGGHKPEYSDEMDYAIGATTLNDTPRMDEKQQHPTMADHELRGKTGLNLKEPLS